MSGLSSSQAPWVDDVAQCLLDAYANPIPDDVLERAAIQLFDMISCASGGFDAEPVRIAQAATAGSGPAEAMVLFAGNHISALDAILVNGTAVRFLDYNDAFIGAGPGGHPSDNSVLPWRSPRPRAPRVGICWPRWFLVTNSSGGSAVRLRTVGRGAPWDGVSVSAVVAAAMAGLLMGLDRKRLSHALSIGLAKGYALKQLRRGSISMIKASANALVARDGVLAARMARHGLTGPAEILEGKSGVLRAFGVGSESDLRATLTARPTWAIRNVSIKAYPAIATAQAAVEAAVRIAGRANLASGVRIVEVRLPDSTATREHLDIETATAARLQGVSRSQCAVPRSCRSRGRQPLAGAVLGRALAGARNHGTHGACPGDSGPRSGDLRPTQLPSRRNGRAVRRAAIHRVGHGCPRESLVPMGIRRG